MSNKITNNYISKTWFYIIDEISPSVIDIWESIYVTILILNTKKPCTINVSSKSTLDLFWLFYDKSPSKILINQVDDSSVVSFKSVFLNKNEDLQTNIKSYISWNNSKSNLKIIWLVSDKKLSIDSNIEVESWVKNWNARLEIENIFLSDKWSVKSLPNLFVRSDDIKASHACKTEKISEAKKFYLKSRWLSDSDASFMLIEGYFVNTFNCLKMIDRGVYENIYERFLEFSR